MVHRRGGGCLAAGASQAATLNVCLPAGSRTDSTIQSAVAAVNPAGGDIVQVGPASYYESITIDRPVAVRGAQAGVDPGAGVARAGGESTISSGFPVTLAASGVVFTGFYHERIVPVQVIAICRVGADVH